MRRGKRVWGPSSRSFVQILFWHKNLQSVQFLSQQPETENCVICCTVFKNKDTKQLTHCFSRGLSIPEIIAGSLLYPTVAKKPTLNLSCYFCQPAISSAYFQVRISPCFFYGLAKRAAVKGKCQWNSFLASANPGRLAGCVKVSFETNDHVSNAAQNYCDSAKQGEDVRITHGDWRICCI